MIEGLLAALGFLTRIPVPASVFAQPAAQTRSLPWYPVVGLMLGTLLSAAAWLLQPAPPLLAAALLLTGWAWITGGLHLDGLADSADAWVGGMGDRERTLQIMKDPRSGPAAVTTLSLLLLLKFAALASLPASSWAWLWLVPMLARALVVAAFMLLPYARVGGIGSGLVLAARLPCALALAAAVLLALSAGRLGLAALALAAMVFVLWRRACLRRLQGMTGDTCGALIELAEAALLVLLVLLG